MKILILEKEQYQVVGRTGPKVGRTYRLEDTTKKSGRQNRAFHPLVIEWFKSGTYPYPAKTWQELKDFVKRDMGAGFYRYIYVLDGKMYKCKNFEDVPKESTDVQGDLKSWADYTMRESRDTMDLLIATMHTCGVNSKKFFEILEGME